MIAVGPSSLHTSSETTVVVGVGEAGLAKAPSEYLVTYALGSCIAAICYDWKLRIGGLVHVMLPDSSIDPDKALRNPFTYADTGIPALCNKMIQAGSSKRTLRSCIVGGAQMLAHSAHFEIGKKNHLAVKRAFWQLGLFIDEEDVGGTASRSVRLEIKTGQVDLRTGTEKPRVLMGPAKLDMGALKNLIWEH